MYGGVSGFTGHCSIENWLNGGIKEPTLGVDANCAENPGVLQLMEGSSCFTDAVKSTSVPPWLPRMLPK
ncbi:hypothetical protein DPMN_030317 [Dreissena polymorpha]|uniref:Uncharacterized protein n=1 Tax=Dreissena polymorpha TaxID=45954 RepID=A0A9D4M0W2_DREPO|nr:hypothetical protein DPMN_030317 [Dreissena polymorpha]